MLEGIFLQIIQIDAILGDYRKSSFETSDKWSEKKRYVKEIKSYLYSKGIRCRKPGGQYPETPDAVFPKYKVALFLYDCFQHAHDCRDSVLPDMNRDFWENRISGTSAEDSNKHRTLRNASWKVLVVWKCELENSRKKETLHKIENQIRSNRILQTEENV